MLLFSIEVCGPALPIFIEAQPWQFVWYPQSESFIVLRTIAGGVPVQLPYTFTSHRVIVFAEVTKTYRPCFRSQAISYCSTSVCWEMVPHVVAALASVEAPTLTTAPMSLLPQQSVRLYTLTLLMRYVRWRSTYHQPLLFSVWLQELPVWKLEFVFPSTARPDMPES